MASKVILALGLIGSALAAEKKAAMSYCDSTPKLELTNIDYEARHAFSGPGNLTSKYAAITFDLSSDGGDLECEGLSQAHPTYFDAKKVYECTSDSWGPSPFNATFTFNRPTNMLSIEAKYACYNYKTESFDTYATAISSKVNLTCDEKVWENKAWTAGAGISSAAHTTCDTTYLVLAPETKVISSKPLFREEAPPPKAPAPKGVVAAAPTPAVTRTTTIIAGATPAPDATEPEFDFDDDEDEEARKRRRQARLIKLTTA